MRRSGLHFPTEILTPEKTEEVAACEDERRKRVFSHSTSFKLRHGEKGLRKLPWCLICSFSLSPEDKERVREWEKKKRRREASGVRGEGECMLHVCYVQRNARVGEGWTIRLLKTHTHKVLSLWIDSRTFRSPGEDREKRVENQDSRATYITQIVVSERRTCCSLFLKEEKNRERVARKKLDFFALPDLLFHPKSHMLLFASSSSSWCHAAQNVFAEEEKAVRCSLIPPIHDPGKNEKKKVA